MSTTLPTPPAQSMFDKILNAVDVALAAAGTLLPGAMFADLLVKLIQKGASAYEQQTGKPIDASLLKSIDPIP